jgi:hypothetical protein
MNEVAIVVTCPADRPTPIFVVHRNEKQIEVTLEDLPFKLLKDDLLTPHPLTCYSINTSN